MYFITFVESQTMLFSACQYRFFFTLLRIKKTSRVIIFQFYASQQKLLKTSVEYFEMYVAFTLPIKDHPSRIEIWHSRKTRIDSTILASWKHRVVALQLTSCFQHLCWQTVLPGNIHTWLTMYDIFMSYWSYTQSSIKMVRLVSVVNIVIHAETKWNLQNLLTT